MNLMETVKKAFRGESVEALRQSSAKGAAVIAAWEAEGELERQAKRNAAAGTRQEADARLLELAIAHKGASAERAARVEAAQTALNAEIKACHQAEGEYRAASGPIERQRDLAERTLRESASPLIAEAMADIRADITATHQLHDHVKERCIDGKDRLVWENYDSIIRRADALGVILRQVEQLVYEPLDDAALTKRINALKATAPNVEQRPAKYGGRSE